MRSENLALLWNYCETIGSIALVLLVFGKLINDIGIQFDRPISGASMNPARSLGPAIVHSEYRGIWIYIVAPILGAVLGAWVYNVIRFTDKPVREIIKTGSFLKESRNNNSNWFRRKGRNLNLK